MFTAHPGASKDKVWKSTNRQCERDCRNGKRVMCRRLEEPVAAAMTGVQYVDFASFRLTTEWRITGFRGNRPSFRYIRHFPFTCSTKQRARLP